MKNIAIDNETFLIERFRPFPPVVCLSWAQADRSAVIPHSGLLYDYILDKLTRIDVRFIGHNIAYDFGTLAASYPKLLPLIFTAYVDGRVTDTMIRQQLYDIATGRVFADDKLNAYSLAQLYELCFDKPLPGPPKTGPDAVRLRYGELYNVDFADWPDPFIEYARGDSVATLEIFNEQENHTAATFRDDGFQTYSAFCLALTAAQGLRTDAGRVAEFKADQSAIMKHIEPELLAAGMLEPKFEGRGDEKRQVGWTKKTKPAQDYIARVCAEKGIEPLLTKPHNPQATPQISTDKTACYWAGDLFLLHRAAYITAEKMLSTYVPFLEAGADGPVTSRLGLAATGRTTSSTPRPPAVGGNQQTAPRKTKKLNDAGELVDSPLGVRECFQARPGKVYLSGDLAGAEMHGLAQVCLWKLGYTTLGEILNAGLDAHLYLACYLLGGTDADYSDIKARYGQGDPLVIEARQDAKPGNFGFGGGMGVKTFIMNQLKEGKRWEYARAKALRESWFKAYPEMTAYFEANKIELGPQGKAVVEFYWSKRLRKVRGFPTLCNGWFQALIADGFKKACNEVIRLCYVGNGALNANHTRPVNVVHDELVTETDDGPGLALAPVVAEFVDTMEREFNELLPDYPTTVDAVLSYKLSKRAKPVYDAQGYLVPWLDL